MGRPIEKGHASQMLSSSSTSTSNPDHFRHANHRRWTGGQFQVVFNLRRIISWACQEENTCPRMSSLSTPSSPSPLRCASHRSRIRGQFNLCAQIPRALLHDSPVRTTSLMGAKKSILPTCSTLFVILATIVPSKRLWYSVFLVCGSDSAMSRPVYSLASNTFTCTVENWTGIPVTDDTFRCLDDAISNFRNAEGSAPSTPVPSVVTMVSNSLQKLSHVCGERLDASFERK